MQLIECFRASGRELGIPLRVLAADCNPERSAACAAADKAFAVPRCTDREFVPVMLDICSKEEVGLVVPTIDTELETFAREHKLFASIGTNVSISSSEVVRICRNKLETSRFLRGIGISTPDSAGLAEVLEEDAGLRFPLILKPVGGSSSVGIRVVNSPEELKGHQEQRGAYMAQELWTGAEYTVNCFFDHEGLRCAVPHRRIEVRGGEVSKGLTERVPTLETMAAALGRAWHGKAFGALCFQAVVNARGEAAVFEINARFGGGYPLAHQAGAVFAQWLIESLSGVGSSAHNRWAENVLMLRYDAAFFKTRQGT